MINQKIRLFFSVFIAFIVISPVAYSDAMEFQNAIKQLPVIERQSIISSPSKKLLEKKNVEETILGELNINGIGLISIETTKLPADLWSNSNEKVLSEKLNNILKRSLASTKKIFKRLLIVDAKPPLNSIGMKNMGNLFLLSRVD